MIIYIDIAKSHLLAFILWAVEKSTKSKTCLSEVKSLILLLKWVILSLKLPFSSKNSNWNDNQTYIFVVKNLNLHHGLKYASWIKISRKNSVVR